MVRSRGISNKVKYFPFSTLSFFAAYPADDPTICIGCDPKPPLQSNGFTNDGTVAFVAYTVVVVVVNVVVVVVTVVVVVVVTVVVVIVVVVTVVVVVVDVGIVCVVVVGIGTVVVSATGVVALAVVAETGGTEADTVVVTGGGGTEVEELPVAFVTFAASEGCWRNEGLVCRSPASGAQHFWTTLVLRLTQARRRCQ